MKQNKSINERNKTAISYLLISLILGAFTSFTGWTIGYRSHEPQYYENAVNPSLGILFLFFSIIIVYHLYINGNKGK